MIRAPLICMALVAATAAGPVLAASGSEVINFDDGPGHTLVIERGDPSEWRATGDAVLDYTDASGARVRVYADHPVTRGEVEARLREGEQAREEGREAAAEGRREAQAAQIEAAQARIEGERDAEEGRREAQAARFEASQARYQAQRDAAQARVEARQAAYQARREMAEARREAEQARAEALADVD